MRAIVASAVTTVLVLALGGAALAHTDLVSSVPAAGSTIVAAPTSVVVNFTEEIKAGSNGSVTDSMGMLMSTVAIITGADHKQLTIGLKPGLTVGAYKVTWHAVAADDGDVSDGTFSFNLAAAAPVAPAPVAAVPRLPNTSTDESGRPLVAIGLLTAAAVLGAISLRAMRARGSQRP